MISKSKFYKIKLEDAVRPDHGDTVYKNQYWAVDDEQSLMVYIGDGAKKMGQYYTFVPQCNKSKSLALQIAGYYDAKVVFLDTVYIPMSLRYEE